MSNDAAIAEGQITDDFDAPEEQEVSRIGRRELHFSALEQFVAVAAHHETPVDLERIVHQHALTRGPITYNRLITIAKENGVKAGISRWSWKKLARMGMAYPALGIMKDGTTAIFSGFRENPEDPNGGDLVIYDLAATEDPSGFTVVNSWSGSGPAKSS